VPFSQLTAGPSTLGKPSFKSHVTETAVILGAGFSTCAGLPIQKRLLDDLLSHDHWTLDKIITLSIKLFLKTVFGWREGDPLPALEDIFTLIDLSAGSGHNLGTILNPKVLRAIRRMLIDRIFTVIDGTFNESTDIDSLIKLYLPPDRPISTHFVVLNWDNVLERHLFKYDPKSFAVDYRVRGRGWNSDYIIGPRRVMIAKVHGSSSWLYCDNCRTVLYSSVLPVTDALRHCVRVEDLELVNQAFGDSIIPAAYGSRYNPVMFAVDGQIFTQNTSLRSILPLNQHAFENCRFCQHPVGPHIATFSFRKSFRTNASALSWQAAEEILSEARKWIFIGYSFPDADIEFKHLVKTCELKFYHDIKKKKNIDVVIKNDEEAEERYARFFGSSNFLIYQSGLEGYLKERQDSHHFANSP
jgi:hypothetical protein